MVLIILERGNSEINAGLNSVDSNFLAVNNYNNSYDRDIASTTKEYAEMLENRLDLLDAFIMKDMLL